LVPVGSMATRVFLLWSRDLELVCVITISQIYLESNIFQGKEISLDKNF
jgi:hypothetical protein